MPPPPAAPPSPGDSPPGNMPTLPAPLLPLRAPASFLSRLPDPLITQAHSFLFSSEVVILTPVGKARPALGGGEEGVWGCCLQG